VMPRDYRTTGQAVASNINTTIAQHPDSFECLLYRADTSVLETTASNADVVGVMESSERAVTYLDPVNARALKVVEGPFFMEAANAGDAPDGSLEQPLVLVLDLEPVPEQSVIQYEEMLDDESRRLVSVFVMKNDMIGSGPHAKMRHYCIPFQSFEGATP